LSHNTFGGDDDEPFRKTEALNDLDTFLAGLDEEFMAELAAESTRRVWDKKTRDLLKESAAQFHDVVRLATKKKAVEYGISIRRDRAKLSTLMPAASD
jgi:hypothetical protein